MTLEFILYTIGFGFWTVLVLFISAAIGWVARKEVGALVGSGVIAAILNFGVTVREAGPNVTDREAAIAAGASLVSSAVAFLLLYFIVRAARDEAAGEPKLVVALAAPALIAGGAAASMAGSLLLTGHWMWNDNTAGLTVYMLLFGGLAVAASELEKEKSKPGKVESAAADTHDH